MDQTKNISPLIAMSTATARRHVNWMTFRETYESAGWLDDPRYVYLGCGAHWFWPLAKTYGTVDYWIVNTRMDGWSWTVQYEDRVGGYASMAFFPTSPPEDPHPAWHWSLYFYDVAKLLSYHYLTSGCRPYLKNMPNRVTRKSRLIREALRELKDHCLKEVEKSFEGLEPRE